MPPSNNRPDDDREWSEFTKSYEREKTYRIAIIGCLTTVVVVTLLVCATILIYKAIDDPPWLKLLAWLLGPTGLAVILVRYWIDRQNKRIHALERSAADRDAKMPPEA
jgi:protein-S-isoprenylcysteine O-methyltransferase Ste14